MLSSLVGWGITEGCTAHRWMRIEKLIWLLRVSDVSAKLRWQVFRTGLPSPLHNSTNSTTHMFDHTWGGRERSRRTNKVNLHRINNSHYLKYSWGLTPRFGDHTPKISICSYSKLKRWGCLPTGRPPEYHIVLSLLPFEPPWNTI